MSGITRRAVYFRKLLFKTNDEKFSLGTVNSKKICRHPGGDVVQKKKAIGLIVKVNTCTVHLLICKLVNQHNGM